VVLQMNCTNKVGQCLRRVAVVPDTFLTLCVIPVTSV